MSEDQSKKEEEDISLRTIISIVSDITLILNDIPLIDDENVNHLLWRNEEDDLPDVLLCNTSGIHSVSANLPRETYLALIGVGAMYDYKFKTLVFDESDEDLSDKNNTYNPFGLNNTH